MWDTQEMWKGQERMKLVFCCNGRDETEGLDLERRRSSVSLLESLLCLAVVFPVNAYKCWRLG